MAINLKTAKNIGNTYNNNNSPDTIIQKKNAINLSRASIKGKGGRGGRGGSKGGTVANIQKDGTGFITNKKLQKRLSTGIYIWYGILNYIYGKYRKRNA